MKNDDYALIVTDGKWRIEPRPGAGGPGTTMEQAVVIIAGTFGMSPEQMLSRQRWKHYAWARKVCALILHERFRVSRRLIGLAMGGRDQQSIWVALHSARVLREKDERFREDYEAAKTAVETMLMRRH